MHVIAIQPTHSHICTCTHSPTHSHPPTHPPTHPLTRMHVLPPTHSLAHVHVHPPTHTHARAPTHLPTHTYACTPTHSHVCTCTHPLTHTYARTPTHPLTRMHVHPLTHSCMWTCFSVACQCEDLSADAACLLFLHLLLAAEGSSSTSTSTTMLMACTTHPTHHAFDRTAHGARPHGTARHSISTLNGSVSSTTTQQASTPPLSRPDGRAGGSTLSYTHAHRGASKHPPTEDQASMHASKHLPTGDQASTHHASKQASATAGWRQD